MTEADWKSCTDATQMLDFLRATGKLSERNARLFAVACCRRIWPLLTDERSRRAVEVAESFSDGEADARQLQVAHAEAGQAAASAHWENQAGSLQTAAEAAVPTAADRVGPDDARYVMVAVAEAVGDHATDQSWEETWRVPGKDEQERWAAEQAIFRHVEGQERAAQAALLRDLVAPFRAPTPMPASLLTPAANSFAQAAYDDRRLPSGELDPARLAALAAALAAAGCTDAELLGHLRDAGPHVRGCWAVDLVLGTPAACPSR
jgi:hypothetical protein